MIKKATVVLTFAFLLICLIILYIGEIIEIKLFNNDNPYYSKYSFYHLLNLGEFTVLLYYTYKSRFIFKISHLNNLPRNINKEYSLVTEFQAVSFVYWLFITIEILYQIFTFEENCVVYFLLSARSFTLILVTMVYPLFHISKCHFPLPPSMITENFKYFLLDEYCLKTFEKFIIDLSCKEEFCFGNYFGKDYLLK
jgi:hypothetical protein